MKKTIIIIVMLLLISSSIIVHQLKAIRELQLELGNIYYDSIRALHTIGLNYKERLENIESLDKSSFSYYSQFYYNLVMKSDITKNPLYRHYIIALGKKSMMFGEIINDEKSNDEKEKFKKDIITLINRLQNTIDFIYKEYGNLESDDDIRLLYKEFKNEESKINQYITNYLKEKDWEEPVINEHPIYYREPNN